jgi:hypothetical protein
MQYLLSFSEDRLISNLKRNIRCGRIPRTIHDVRLLGENVYKLATEQHYEEYGWAPKKDYNFGLNIWFKNQAPILFSTKQMDCSLCCQAFKRLIL